jgi:hypothetical protein
VQPINRRIFGLRCSGDYYVIENRYSDKSDEKFYDGIFEQKLILTKRNEKYESGMYVHAARHFEASQDTQLIFMDVIRSH